MKVLLLTLAAVLCVESTHLVVGNVANRVTLVNRELVEYNAIPFMKRVKQYFYTLPPGEQTKVIQGIQALDNLHSKSSINITAGGVGFTYVNLRLKSERGRGLSYDIGIYVEEKYN